MRRCCLVHRAPWLASPLRQIRVLLLPPPPPVPIHCEDHTMVTLTPNPTHPKVSVSLKSHDAHFSQVDRLVGHRTLSEVRVLFRLVWPLIADAARQTHHLHLGIRSGTPLEIPPSNSSCDRNSGRLRRIPTRKSLLVWPKSRSCR
jgi:hypothetical protein